MIQKTYRPEIDGLRSIAILLVIIYHAEFIIAGYPLFSGGFIGVDIFFVISGYLITRIIVNETFAHKFSFITFYERRARRILPALSVVALLSSIFAWLYLTPEQLTEYGSSLIATATFVANIFFYGQDSYTAEISAHKPLLHMWSLGIEEQFYIFFPVILIIWTKFTQKKLNILLFCLLLFSLGLAEYTSATSQDAAFYLIPFRAWELFAGCIMAVAEIESESYSPPSYTRILPSVGFLIILAFATIYDDTIRHPSLLTALPILGTMMIIWFASPDSITIKILSSRPAVAIGLISYSLYLWHQPAFAFARVIADRNLLNIEKIGLISLSFILAVISYHYVEKKTRNRKTMSNRTIWTIAAIGTFGMLIFGGLTIHYKGFPERFPNVSAMIANAQIKKYIVSPGGREQINFNPGKKYITFSNPARPTGGLTLLTVGDSHIRTLETSLADQLPTAEAVSKFVPLSRSDALFMLGMDRVDMSKKDPVLSKFDRYNKKRFKAVTKDFANPVVITGGRFPAIIEESYFDNQEGGRETGKFSTKWVKTPYKKESKQRYKDIRQAFRSTINQLLKKGVKVVLIYPIPEVGWNVPKKIISKISGKNAEDAQNELKNNPLTTSYEVYKRRSRRTIRMYNSIKNNPNLLRIYPVKIFCKKGRCYTHDLKMLYYRDDDHLSYQGATILVKNIYKEIEKKWGKEMNIK